MTENSQMISLYQPTFTTWIKLLQLALNPQLVLCPPKVTFAENTRIHQIKSWGDINLNLFSFQACGIYYFWGVIMYVYIPALAYLFFIYILKFVL